MKSQKMSEWEQAAAAAAAPLPSVCGLVLVRCVVYNGKHLTICIFNGCDLIQKGSELSFRVPSLLRYDDAKNKVIVRNIKCNEVNILFLYWIKKQHRKEGGRVVRRVGHMLITTCRLFAFRHSKINCINLRVNQRRLHRQRIFVALWPSKRQATSIMKNKLITSRKTHAHTHTQRRRSTHDVNWSVGPCMNRLNGQMVFAVVVKFNKYSLNI